MKVFYFLFQLCQILKCIPGVFDNEKILQICDLTSSTGRKIAAKAICQSSRYEKNWSLWTQEIWTFCMNYECCFDSDSNKYQRWRFERLLVPNTELDRYLTIGINECKLKSSNVHHCYDACFRQRSDICCLKIFLIVQ